jgi:hypothetical protein
MGGSSFRAGKNTGSMFEIEIHRPSLASCLSKDVCLSVSFLGTLIEILTN